MRMTREDAVEVMPRLLNSPMADMTDRMFIRWLIDRSEEDPSWEPSKWDSEWIIDLNHRTRLNAKITKTA